MEYKFTVDEQYKDCRLDIFIQNKLSDLTRSHIKILIENESILLNNKKPFKAGIKLKIGDLISVSILEPKNTDIRAEDIKLDILYQDKYLAVINKPQGMVVHPARNCYSGTLVNALLFNIKDLSGINGEIRPGIVHRLDKDTSGLLVIAKDDKTHVALQKQIQTKICKRIYRAIVYGKFNDEEGCITTDLARSKSDYKKICVVPSGQGKLAITNYKTLNYKNGLSYMEYELKTGRTHQIRVHSAYMGHPIVGDKVYGKKNEKYGLNGQLLHAYKLKFIHPVTDEQMEFTANLPDFFEKFLTNYIL